MRMLSFKDTALISS